MALNEFLPFATEPGAAVDSQAVWASPSGYRPDGYTSGILTKEKLNKALRQSSSGVSALMEAVMSALGEDVRDDGDIAHLADQISRSFLTLPTLEGTSVNQGANILGYRLNKTGAVDLTQYQKNAQVVNVEDLGAVGDGITNDTVHFQNALSAVVAAGGWGVLEMQAGKQYNLDALVLDGIIGLTIRGKNGGNQGNLSPGSSGGSTLLHFTNTTGDSLSFVGQSYHAAKITLQDVCLHSATTGFTLRFDNVSEVCLNRVSVSNDGGTTPVTGNGIRLSNCYNIFFNQVNWWKTTTGSGGTLYQVGQGLVIDRGSMTSFLGGEYNFLNCSWYGWQSGLKGGNDDPAASADESFANLNIINCEVNSNAVGVTFMYGLKSAVLSGCYVEGNLNVGVLVANRPRSCAIKCSFFNNSTASSADIQVGLNGVGANYQRFYGVHIKENIFIQTKIAGVSMSGLAGNSVSIADCEFYLPIAGSKGISTGQTDRSTFFIDVARCNGYGYAQGDLVFGAATRVQDCWEYNADGSTLAVTVRNTLRFASYATDTQLTGLDPETVTIVNTRAGAKLLAPNLTLAKGSRFMVVNAATSTQNLLVRDQVDATTLVTLTPGQKAMVWNDGTTAFAGLLN